MNPRAINDLLSRHFTRLDKIVTTGTRDPSKRRNPAAMGLTQTERILYFVWDVVSITCNAGMGAWIHYHIDDEGWIDEAASSFAAIGHKRTGEDLGVCLLRYRSAAGSLDDWNDDDLSEPVWDSEDQIMLDLFRYLTGAGFPFQTP